MSLERSFTRNSTTSSFPTFRKGDRAANSADQPPGDHSALIHLNEPCVLENSRLRFMEDAIYTLVGTIMIAAPRREAIFETMGRGR